MRRSLVDEEKRSTELDTHGTDQGGAQVGNCFYIFFDWIEESADMPGRARAGQCPEVCSAVANTDKPTVPSSTFRAVLGWSVPFRLFSFLV